MALIIKNGVEYVGGMAGNGHFSVAGEDIETGEDRDVHRDVAYQLAAMEGFSGPLYRAGWVEMGNQYSLRGYWTSDPEREVQEDW